MKIDMLPVPELSVPGADDIRLMTPEEIAAEEPIFKAAGTTLPDPSTSAFIGAYRGGKRVAFLVLQVRLHAEPLFIEPGHSAILPALVKKAEEHILSKCGPQWVYVFTPAGKITQLAASLGMQLEPWVVMSKLVMPDVPTSHVVPDLSPIVDSEEQIQ